MKKVGLSSRTLQTLELEEILTVQNVKNNQVWNQTVWV